MPLRFKLLLSLCLLAPLLACGAMPRIEAETFRNPQRIALPVDPYAVTTGDLNGDGRNDIIWVEHPMDSLTSVLHVLLAGANGQYTPAANVSLPSGYNAFGCIVEDVTGDKQSDVICVGVSNYVNVTLFTYSGHGDGTFATPIQTSVTAQPAYTTPILARSGDLNGDGLPDIVLMNADYSGVLPFLSDGHGGFQVGENFQGSFNSSIPTIADLNGDGKLDVLWPTGPRVNLGKGDGTFGAISQYDPGYLSNCAFGDVDHDGHLDAVCTWYDVRDIDSYIHLTVLHGNPDGTFNKTPLFTRTFGNGEHEYDGIPTILSPVLITDLNGDGYDDIVSLSGDGYCVLLGGPSTTWNGQPQQFVAASLQSQRGVTGIYGVSIADMNGDGLPDIVAVGPNGLYITYAQHDGTLSSAPAPEVGQVSSSATLADFNGDGNLDVVSAGDTALKLSLGRGDGTFTSPQPITTSGNFGVVNYEDPQVVHGDFNGDGKQDLLATGSIAVNTSQTYLLLGHGDGSFDSPKPIGISIGKVADLNGDGLSDVYSVQNDATSGNVLTASISRGDGTFTTASTKLPSELTHSFIARTSGPALADFRHSGHLDAAVASINNAYVLRSHGDGTFDSTGAVLAIPGLPNLTNLGSFDLASGDFDGDGNPDVAVLVQYGNGPNITDTPTSAVWIYYGNGDGTFSTAVLAGTFNRDTQTLSAGDLNGDSLADLVLTSYDVYQDNGVLVAHALPNRAWGPEVDYTGGEGLAALWITDINHDGRNDLIFSNAHPLNYSSNSISVLLNQADNTVTVARAPSVAMLTASPSAASYGTVVTLTATISAASPATPGGLPLPTGTVTFTIDGNSQPPVGLSSAIAVDPVSNLPAGLHTISCTYSGDSNFAPTTCNAISVTIQPGTSALTITSSQNPSQAYTTVTFTIHLTLNGKPAPAGTPLTFSVFLNAGNVILTTDAGGNATYSTSQLFARTWFTEAIFSAGYYTASIANYTQVVTGAPTTVSLAVTPNPAYTGQTVTLMATATGSGTVFPTGAITFLDGGAFLGTGSLNASGQATFSTSGLTPGTHAITATFPGDAGFSAGTSPIVNEVVLNNGFTIALMPPSITLTQGATGLTAIQLASLGDFTGPLVLTYGKLPSYATIAMNSANPTLTKGGSQSSTLTFSTMSFPLKAVDGKRRSKESPVFFSALLLLLAPLSFKRRHRFGRVLGAALLLVSLQAITACGYSGEAATLVAPGSYQIPITATDTHGNAQSATFTVTITPR